MTSPSSMCSALSAPVPREDPPQSLGPVACTIVANNYLAFASVFSRSFLEHHPSGKVFVLLVDEPLWDFDYESEPYELVEPSQLGIADFLSMAFRYDTIELCTALKPFFLRYLQRAAGCDRLCYFDPDIWILGDLAPLYDRFAAFDLLLTPHITAPMDDRRFPTERDILAAGVYNLGFVGLARSAATDRLLDWWQGRLRWECRNRVETGLFVDQRWMDLAPALVERTAILHDRGLNVAYWNLAHRRLERRHGRWHVGDELLRFFHFSGHDPGRPQVVSKYQNRVTFDDSPELELLFASYGARLIDAGHRRLHGLTYGWSCFDDGRPIPALARDLLATVDPEGERWTDPFDTEAEGSFRAWMLGAASDLAPTPTRLAIHLWWRRGDLRQAFPSPGTLDRPAFERWLAEAPDEHLGCEREWLSPIAPGGPRSNGHGLPRGSDSRIQPTEEALRASGDSDAKTRPFLPRFALEIHERRQDVRVAFPFPLAQDRAAFAYWLVTEGRLEYRLPGRWLAPTLSSLSWRQRASAALRFWRLRWSSRARNEGPSADESVSTRASSSRDDSHAEKRRARRARPVPADAPGVNVVGWPSSETGVGEACRGTLQALEAAGIRVSALALEEGRHEPTAMRYGLPYATTLWHVNADMLPLIRSSLPRALLVARRELAIWYWELSYFPRSFARAFEGLEAVWAPSRFCADAYRPLSPIPVEWVPPAVPRRDAVAMPRSSLGISEDAFLFLYVFDVRSRHERKNPLGLLAAFALAAARSRRSLHLLLHVNRPEADPQLVNELRRAALGPSVTLSTRPARRETIDRFFATCDAYVSLHRSEGLGLPLIESSHLGKPVVATGYGGVTDFLDADNSWIVPHRVVSLEQDIGPYPQGATWAEPDVDAAAAQMVAVAEAPVRELRRRAALAQARVRALYDPQAFVARLRRELGPPTVEVPAAPAGLEARVHQAVAE